MGLRASAYDCQVALFKRKAYPTVDVKKTLIRVFFSRRTCFEKCFHSDEKVGDWLKPDFKYTT